MNLTDEEVRAELKEMAYSTKGFNEVITFIWALPDSFWTRVSKRLIATVIVGVQPEPVKIEPTKPDIWWDPRGCFRYPQ